MRILGIDPGLLRTGWGIIEASGSRLRYIECGVIRVDAKQQMAARLADLALELERVVSRFSPDAAAVEETFVNTNPKSALVLGQARGIALMAPARLGVVVAEYPANTIKKSVVGAGHADKDQVVAMIRLLLPGASFKLADAADALAVAVCHAHHAATANRWQRVAEVV